LRGCDRRLIVELGLCVSGTTDFLGRAHEFFTPRSGAVPVWFRQGPKTEVAVLFGLFKGRVRIFKTMVTSDSSKTVAEGYQTISICLSCIL
jgi:hypothetical protein